MLAIVAVILTCGVCGFFVYVLVQFRRDEKHPRHAEEGLAGFPMVASGQIVRPFAEARQQSNEKAATHKDTGGSSKKRGA